MNLTAYMIEFYDKHGKKIVFEENYNYITATFSSQPPIGSIIYFRELGTDKLAQCIFLPLLKNKFFKIISYVHPLSFHRDNDIGDFTASNKESFISVYVKEIDISSIFKNELIDIPDLRYLGVGSDHWSKNCKEILKE